jgi:predicted ArsR family transcriptional regulator
MEKNQSVMAARKRRFATPEERKALAHPVRMRILRLCLDESLTNKEIAVALGIDPGSTLYHVRKLAEDGFLVPEEVRAGKRGALEKPYRATGKSWELDMGFEEPSSTLAMLDVFRAEFQEAGEKLLFSSRAALQLTDDRLEELRDRLQETIDEFAEVRDPDGHPIGLFAAMHERSKPRRRR